MCGCVSGESMHVHVLRVHVYSGAIMRVHIVRAYVLGSIGDGIGSPGSARTRAGISHRFACDFPIYACASSVAGRRCARARVGHACTRDPGAVRTRRDAIPARGRAHVSAQWRARSRMHSPGESTRQDHGASGNLCFRHRAA